jgi:homoserine/homoserine lactone efflux protein
MLVTSIGIRRGVRSGLIAVLGSSTVATIYVAVVVAGLASVVALVSEWFAWIRWLGVTYLLYLGLRAWFSTEQLSKSVSATRSATQEFVKGFVTTATNPKMLFFLSAFFPQFVDPALPVTEQLFILATTFILLLTLLDSCWVLLASTVGSRLKSARLHQFSNKLTAGLLIGAGATLALARRS